MLLEFRTKNYKSFAEEMDFSMTPAPKQKGLDYSILSMQAGSKTYNGLSSAVIYGPNASGKTNVIGAMDTFRSIVLRGSIRNADMILVLDKGELVGKGTHDELLSGCAVYREIVQSQLSSGEAAL